jgi:hypothetical protein
MWVFEFVDQYDGKIEIIIEVGVVEALDTEEVSGVDEGGWAMRLTLVGKG